MKKPSLCLFPVQRISSFLSLQSRLSVEKKKSHFLCCLMRLCNISRLSPSPPAFSMYVYSVPAANKVGVFFLTYTDGDGDGEDDGDDCDDGDDRVSV